MYVKIQWGPFYNVYTCTCMSYSVNTLCRFLLSLKCACMYITNRAYGNRVKLMYACIYVHAVPHDHAHSQAGIEFVCAI